ncbi:MerR family transcriptional regulator, partial [Enterococcus faecium]|nr:MerR family transcriptional regulator [Enterococcus faecium]
MKYLSIGKISKLCNISIRTLRYYDQINLFKPEYINKENNYRYYSIQQLFYLEIIKYLRKLNMP